MVCDKKSTAQRRDDFIFCRLILLSDRGTAFQAVHQSRFNNQELRTAWEGRSTFCERPGKAVPRRLYSSAISLA